MKKLIAIDLDGTLLSSNLDISNENIQAIQHAQEAGHLVMICSGRAPEDIKVVLDQTPLQCPLAGSNGTMVVADGKLLSQISINKETVKSIAAILDEKKYPFKIYTSQGIFVASSWTERMNTFLEQNPDISKNLTPKEYKLMTEQPKETDTLKLFNDLNQVLAPQEVTVQKFFIPTLSGKAELISTIEKVAGISVTTSGPFNIEIMDINGHKGNGIRVMAEYFNIPIEHTVAIGDNFNDVPMLKTAGLSIAMGNGDPAVKEIADVVTLTNNEHGVAHAIEKYVLANK